MTGTLSPAKPHETLTVAFPVEHQTGPVILSEWAHGECCDECGEHVFMDGFCPNCDLRDEQEAGLRRLYQQLNVA